MKDWNCVERTPEEIRHPRITNDTYLQLSAISEDIERYGHYAKGVLLDVGAGKAPYAPFLTPYVKRYLKLDSFAYPGGDPDVLGNGMNLPIKSNSLDTVFSSQVLEHVPYPQAMVDEFYRVLKPGGICIATTHMANPLHGMPHDYFRFTKQAFRYVLFKGFSKIHVLKENGGAILSVGQFVVWAISNTLPTFLGKPIIAACNWFIKKLDRWRFNDVFTTNYIIVAEK